MLLRCSSTAGAAGQSAAPPEPEPGHVPRSAAAPDPGDTRPGVHGDETSLSHALGRGRQWHTLGQAAGEAAKTMTNNFIMVIIVKCMPAVIIIVTTIINILMCYCYYCYYY